VNLSELLERASIALDKNRNQRQATVLLIFCARKIFGKVARNALGLQLIKVSSSRMYYASPGSARRRLQQPPREQ
jgi:hypothetical protein